MSGPFYLGDGGQRGNGGVTLPEPIHVHHEDPAGYRPDAGLVSAFNVSLLLGQPLLITGEPGTGKTLFARSVAHELALPPPLEVRVKSNTTGASLLYTFDELSLFRDNQANRTPRPLARYLRFNGLGEAILHAAGANARLRTMQGEELRGDESVVREGFGANLGPGRPTAGDLLPGLSPAGRSFVVLIDELDKAPRDTPNDLLREIEDMAFDIPELGVRIALDRGAPTHRPIVIVTSNSEKSLPEAFLRRCAYYHIPFPAGGMLRSIINSRIGILDQRRGMLDDALVLFERFRARFRKPPGTAELLGWLELLSKDEQMQEVKSFRHRPEVVMRYLPALAKVPEDLMVGREEILTWSKA